MLTYNNVQDDRLIELYLKGESNAFDELLNRYNGQVHNYISVIVKDSNIADDLFQETFIKVINKIQSNKYEPQGKFAQWLMRVTYHVVMDYYRKAKRTASDINHAISIDDDDVYINLADDDSERIEKIRLEQAITLVESQIEHLPDNQREVVNMRYKEQLSFKEIAERTGVSINTSLGRMRYALINLRKMMGNHQTEWE